MKTRTVAALIKAIEKSKARLETERDKLRELISEADAIESSLGRAVDHLDDAADALSEYV